MLNPSLYFAQKLLDYRTKIKRVWLSTMKCYLSHVDMDVVDIINQMLGEHKPTLTFDES